MTGYRPYLALLPAVLLLGVLFAGGLSFAVLESVQGPNGTFSLEHYRALLVEPELRESIVYTLLLSSVATGISTALGLLAALTLRRFSRGSRLLTILVQLPLAVPHLAMAVLVLDVLGQSGLIARLFHLAGSTKQPSDFPELLHDRFGVGILVTYILKETPFITLVALAALRRSIGDYEAVAATLGASAWQRFRHVTLPLIAPSLISAALMVFAFVFGSFEVGFLLGRSYPPLLGVLVQRRYMSTELADRPDAIAAGVLMSIVSAVFVFAYLRLSVRLVGERPVLF